MTTSSLNLKGMKNRYTCQKCGFSFVTVDRDEGTTPFMTVCRAPTACDGFAQSEFYRIDQTLEPVFEWYIPGQAEVRKIRDPHMRHHVDMGGLLLRPVIRVIRENS